MAFSCCCGAPMWLRLFFLVSRMWSHARNWSVHVDTANISDGGGAVETAGSIAVLLGFGTGTCSLHAFLGSSCPPLLL